MGAVWEWLNGKKTAIGAVILAIVANGLIPDDAIVAGVVLVDVLTWLGNLLVGGGITHKGVKAATK